MLLVKSELWVLLSFRHSQTKGRLARALLTLSCLFRAATSPFFQAVQDILGFFAQTYREVFKFPLPPLHDPCAVALLIAPELFQVPELADMLPSAEAFCL